jgi:hypothetical protein
MDTGPGSLDGKWQDNIVADSTSTLVAEMLPTVTATVGSWSGRGPFELAGGDGGRRKFVPCTTTNWPPVHAVEGVTDVIEGTAMGRCYCSREMFNIFGQRTGREEGESGRYAYTAAACLSALALICPCEGKRIHFANLRLGPTRCLIRPRGNSARQSNTYGCGRIKRLLVGRH